ncbi:unnamed protein product [Spirodela intermedia]|uniref:Uncharacterized protein n=1 Tax=Spirodela intermedia TaxID=51605 RepID=A0A7I8IDE7_SPIIN|nr:unnamed protein product [Spirodela intermedia]CAA6654861.1 unnamed protein product [Spirodela intermedia]
MEVESEGQLPEEEEYIDMDVSSAAFSRSAAGSPPHAREFEFRMDANFVQREPVTSPADELFYKGKLLPLHLPPRLKMVQRLLQDPATAATHGEEEEEEAGSAAAGVATPFESCTVSPVSSCYVSGELNPEECSQPLPKKSWSKKLKLIRQSSLGLKLKASRDYLKCLFTRPARSAAMRAPRNGDPPFGLIQWETTMAHRRMNEEKTATAEECSHRRSFTGVLNHHPATVNSSSSPSSSTSSSSSSSSSSSTAAGGGELQGPAALKRSSSVNSEVECSIQGAIAYCKKSSQQVAGGRKSFGDVGCCTLSYSKVAAACET